MKSERHLDGAASAPAWLRLWAWFVWLALALAVVTVLSACATGPRLVTHGFGYEGWSDGWANDVELLEFSYGDQYPPVQGRAKGDVGLGYSWGVNGSMPIGEFLYVKWRIKASGEVLAERVDLRDRLPRDMTDHELTFVIDGRQLYVYVVTPERKKSYSEPPLLRTWLSKFAKAYEVFPAKGQR
ncbi:MAG: hypothetical protein R3E99_13140 [Burkholderiaceae bacterium]